MVGCKDASDVAKKLLKLHRKKSNSRPMMSFVHNGSKIKAWIGHNFKTKNTKFIAAFLR